MATSGSTSRLSLPSLPRGLATLASVGLLALAACTDGATPVCSGDAGCGTDTFDATVFEAGFEAGSEAGADARDAGTKPEAASADTGMDTATPADAGAPADTGAEASSGDATSDAPPADAPAAQG